MLALLPRQFVCVHMPELVTRHLIEDPATRRPAGSRAFAASADADLRCVSGKGEKALAYEMGAELRR